MLGGNFVPHTINTKIMWRWFYLNAWDMRERKSYVIRHCTCILPGKVDTPELITERASRGTWLLQKYQLYERSKLDVSELDAFAELEIKVNAFWKFKSLKENYLFCNVYCEKYTKCIISVLGELMRLEAAHLCIKADMLLKTIPWVQWNVHPKVFSTKIMWLIIMAETKQKYSYEARYID